MGNKNGKSTYIASTLIALLIWSTSFVATKIAFETFPPITLGAARFTVATVALGLVLLITRQFKVPSKKHLPWICLSGALGITLYFTMENIGLDLTSASNAALIVASYPAMISLLERIIYKTPLTPQRIIGILIAIAGVAVLTGVQPDSGSNPLLGNIILVLTGIVWAFYSFVTRKVVNEYPLTVFSFYQTAAGMVLFLPLSLFEMADWQAPNISSFSMLLYLGIFCSVAAFMLYNFGLRKLTAGTASTLMNTVPVFGVIFSVIILGESVSAPQLIGGAIVIIGIIVSLQQGKKARASAKPDKPLDDSMQGFTDKQPE